MSGFAGCIFDLGGVVLGSPLPAIRSYEADLGLEPGSLGRVVRLHGEAGAWASHERGELAFPAFVRAFAAEGRELGIEFSPVELMRRIAAAVRPRPEMVAAVEAVRAAGLRTAALTNNWAEPAPAAERFHGLRGLFDVFVESCVVGMRKPDPRIYEHALGELALPPEAVVFLDDMGRNLKPARAMGMATIKVDEPAAALAELGALVGLALADL